MIYVNIYCTCMYVHIYVKCVHFSSLHFTPKDAFIGFQSETLAAIVLQATKEAESRIYHFEWKEKVVYYKVSFDLLVICKNVRTDLLKLESFIPFVDFSNV